MSKTTVLHVIDTLDRGGAERLLVDLVNNFDRQRVRPIVCTTRELGPLGSELDRQTPVEVLGRRHRWDVSAMWRFSQIVVRQGVEIIHAHGYGSTAFVTAAQALIGGLRPVICHVHSSAGVPWPMRPARYGVTRIVCPSDESAQQMRTSLGLDSSMVTVVPNVIDLRRYPSPRPRVSGRVLTGVALANIRPVKDLLMLLRAVERCRSRDRITLQVAGAVADASYLAECRRFSAEVGLDRTIQFVGPISDVPALLASADFAVLSSRSETGPIALIEYLAAALPFAATLTGQVANICAAHDVGALVAIGDFTALAKEIDRIANISPLDRFKEGARGYTLAVRSFDARIACERFAEIYADTLGRKAA